MATVGTNRPSGYDDHHNHHQNPLQADDEFSLRHMMDTEPTGPNDGRDILSGSKSIPAAGAGSNNNGVVDITATQKMVSAMSGSLLTSLLVTPLDVVRVRLQSQKAPRSTVDFSKLAITTTSLSPAQTAELGITSCCREVFFSGGNAEFCLAAPRIDGIVAPPAPAECAVEEVQRRTFSSTFDGLRKIARNEGVTTLWRGLSPTLVMAVPSNIIYFTGYDYLRFNPKSPFSHFSDTSAPLTAGSAARVLAATAVSPIELVKTRMQAAHGASTTNHLVEAFESVKEMVGSHGYTALWRGLTLTLWRDVPFSGLYWWGYESIRSRLTDYREQRHGHSLPLEEDLSEARRRSQVQENHTETFVDAFTAGALSGAFASFVTTPFDVGKTRTQIYQDSSKKAKQSSASAVAAPEERSMVRLLWHIFKTEGASGLWKGWIPRTLKVAPACAIMISSYEVGKRAFRGVNERHLHSSNDPIMYTLNCADGLSLGRDVYVLGIHRTSVGLASISSDQFLSVLDPTRLSAGPQRRLPTQHGNLTTLQVFDSNASIVCTAGENGTVGVWDLRQGANVVQFQASQAPILSMACSLDTQTIAVGTELQNHTASIHLWDVRSTPSSKAHYQEVHSDDVTDLSFNPSNPALLLSGSTDGLVNVYDTRVADEDDLTVQTCNVDASIHRAAWLSATEVAALSHDERCALYDVSEERANGDAVQDFGDMRSVLGCQYVADITPKMDGSGAILGVGAQDKQGFELVFLAKNPSGEGWALDRENSVGLPGAHGEEIVRSFCFFDEAHVVYTAGEDGNVKAWRPN
ncbi:mitochondrial carrier family [Fusarium pseudocircinatum]|uniref:Mitochondrial carrier family n=1 Tax=Fusarium pseudocircinatum TaxID=56676 RepID=A0A8H5P8N6_9HYPO|nr:mitochondrial carrier family [Fusarium pseudocircinatum]